MAAKTVDEYISMLEESKAKIVEEVRSIILEATPEVKESIKWAQSVYESNGPFAYVRVFKESVNFGFWRGIDLDDPKGILQGTGEKMRHVKLCSPADIDEEELARMVLQAIKLNEEKGDPTKGRKS
jgi:hypothetical protein